MGENTKIEWADHTFNPWVGCSKVSAACTNCYAEGWALRTGQPGLWRGERRRTSAANWRKPLRWNVETPGARVFCASLADVFEDRPELGSWRGDLFELIQDTPALTWLLLTKRPEIAVDWFRNFDPPANVWLGTTVENQAAADERIPLLLQVNARVRFLSMEPLLGPVDLAYTCFNGADSFGTMPGIHWVIAGGESGPRARPSHPSWFRTIRDDCERAGVPFHFKQHGEWLPDSEIGQRDDPDLDVDIITGRYQSRAIGPVLGNEPQVLHTLHRVGKERAGRVLDGRTWDGLPSSLPSMPIPEDAGVLDDEDTWDEEGPVGAPLGSVLRDAVAEINTLGVEEAEAAARDVIEGILGIDERGR